LFFSPSPGDELVNVLLLEHPAHLLRAAADGDVGHLAVSYEFAQLILGDAEDRRRFLRREQPARRRRLNRYSILMDARHRLFNRCGQRAPGRAAL